MIVKCTSATAETLPLEALDRRASLDRATEFPLTVGKEYVVYAVDFQHDRTAFYIFDDNDLAWPMRYLSGLFSVVDSRVASSWRFVVTEGNRVHSALLAIREWAEDPFFYDRLTDGLPSEVALFRTARALIDSEARL